MPCFPCIWSPSGGIDRNWANTLVALSRITSLGMAFLAGWLSDRFGPRWTLMTILLLTGITTLILGGSGPDPLGHCHAVFSAAGGSLLLPPGVRGALVRGTARASRHSRFRDRPLRVHAWEGGRCPRASDLWVTWDRSGMAIGPGGGADDGRGYVDVFASAGSRGAVKKRSYIAGSSPQSAPCFDMPGTNGKPQFQYRPISCAARVMAWTFTGGAVAGIPHPGPRMNPPGAFFPAATMRLHRSYI